jgi:hypothetical protein
VTPASAIPDELRMSPEHYRLYRHLRLHVGRINAVSMAKLYEHFSGERLPRDAKGKPDADVPALSRHMRKLIDDLRDIWGIAVMSSSHAGYWICADKKEVADVCREFRARGLKSLTTAARLKNISLADEVRQIEIDLRNQPEGETPPCPTD